jgi:hypothetical protein
VLGKHGGDRRSQSVSLDQDDNISLKYGTSCAYLLARLRRVELGIPNSTPKAKTGAQVARETGVYVSHGAQPAQSAIRVWRLGG